MNSQPNGGEQDDGQQRRSSAGVGRQRGAGSGRTGQPARRSRAPNAISSEAEPEHGEGRAQEEAALGQNAPVTSTKISGVMPSGVPPSRSCNSADANRPAGPQQIGPVDRSSSRAPSAAGPERPRRSRQVQRRHADQHQRHGQRQRCDVAHRLIDLAPGPAVMANALYARPSIRSLQAAGADRRIIWRPQPARQPVIDQPEILDRVPVHEGLDPDRAVVDSWPPRPPASPGGNMPPWPEVTMRSPTAMSARRRQIVAAAAGRSCRPPGRRARAMRSTTHGHARVDIRQQQDARRPRRRLRITRPIRPSPVIAGLALATPSRQPAVDQDGAHESAAGVGRRPARVRRTSRSDPARGSAARAGSCSRRRAGAPPSASCSSAAVLLAQPLVLRPQVADFMDAVDGARHGRRRLREQAQDRRDRHRSARRTALRPARMSVLPTISSAIGRPEQDEAIEPAREADSGDDEPRPAVRDFTGLPAMAASGAVGATCDWPPICGSGAATFISRYSDTRRRCDSVYI